MVKMEVFRLSATQDVLGVSALTRLVKEQIETSFAGVWVRGEVSNLTKSFAGHHYFNLREGDALLKAVLFKGRGRFFSKHLSEGTEVICYGDITVYEPRGEYQLIVEFVEPAGLGAMFAQLEILKKRLMEEGLFGDDRKRAIPLSPRCVALVASHSSAALQDMLRILDAYPLPLEVLVYPIASQGDEAPSSICRAFEAISRHRKAEVVVLARGGGSVEDLWAFNHEAVVRAVAGSEIPVITGIGHETDTTLSDLAADLRAPTPTAAAEVLLSNAQAEINRLFELKSRMGELMMHKIYASRIRLGTLKEGLLRMDPMRRLREQRLHLMRLGDTINQLLERGIMGRRTRLTAHLRRLERLSPLMRLERERDNLRRVRLALHRLSLGRVQDERHRLGLLSERLNGLSPLRPLERGYALCTKDGEVVRAARNLSPGEVVDLRFSSDTARCLVEEVSSLSGEVER